MRKIAEKWKRIFRRQSLVSKIVWALSGIIMLPAMILTSVWLQKSRETAYQEAYRECRSVVEAMVKDMIANGMLVDNTITIALNQKEFLRFCNGDMGQDGLKLVKFSQQELARMRYIFLCNSLLESGGFYFYNPLVYEIWDTIYRYDRIEEKDFDLWLHEQKKTVYIPEGVTQQAKGKLACYREVYLDTMPVGVLEIRIPYEKFFSGLKEERPEGSFCVVRLSDGQILGNGVEGDGFAKELEKCLEPDRGSEAFWFTYDKEKFYGVYQYLEDFEVYVISFSSERVLMEEIRKKARLAIAAAFCLLLLCFLVSSLVYRKMLSRLTALKSGMEEVQKGELSVRMREREDGDELDQISGSFNRMLERMEELIRQNVERETAVKDAQLNALQSQINSHFLYNALESIRMMAEVEGQCDVADTLVSLGNLMRYQMSWKSKTVSLREELESIKKYVFFINMINEYQVELTIGIQERFLDTDIPKLCLQPLVENCVVHGIPKGGKSIRINLGAVENGRVLVLQVTDDGAGIEKERLMRINRVLQGYEDESLIIGKNGIGIVNVHKRLQMNYGVEYGIVLESREGVCTQVKVVMPNVQNNLGGW